VDFVFRDRGARYLQLVVRVWRDAAVVSCRLASVLFPRSHLPYTLMSGALGPRSLAAGNHGALVRRGGFAAGAGLLASDAWRSAAISLGRVRRSRSGSAAEARLRMCRPRRLQRLHSSRASCEATRRRRSGVALRRPVESDSRAPRADPFRRAPIIMSAPEPPQHRRLRDPVSGASWLLSPVHCSAPDESVACRRRVRSG